MDRITDSDPVETREWRDALESVLAVEGVERAHFLLDELMHEARRKGAPVPYSANTPYLNTIPPDREAPHPGDRAIEHRIRSLHPLERARDRAARQQGELGAGRPHRQLPVLGPALRHRLHAFLARADREPWRRPGLHPGPLLARHLRPQLHRGPAQRGAAAQVPPGGRRRGAELLSASLADAGLLAVPDGLDGPRAADGDLPGPLPQVSARPRARRHRQPQGLGVPGRRRVRRAGEPGRHLAGRARASRQSGVRDQLQPAAPRRAGARQRQDHPGAGGHLPRRRLERDQGAVGLGLGQADRRRHHRHPAQAHGGGGRRRVPGLQVEERRLRPRALLRQVSRARRHGRRLDRRPDLGAGPRRPRSVQGLRRLPRRPAPQGPADRHPRQDRQGLRHGRGRRGPEHHPSAEEDGRDRTCTISPTASACR